MLTLHDKAPDFSLKDQDGHLIKLSDYKGSYVVIYFYPKDNTPGCTIQACHYRDFMTQFNQHQIKVFGISKDDEESHQKFTQDFNLNFQLLVDSDLSVIKAYDVWQEKNMYGKIMMGVVRSTFVVNPEGLIHAIFLKADPSTDADLVLDSILT